MGMFIFSGGELGGADKVMLARNPRKKSERMGRNPNGGDYESTRNFTNNGDYFSDQSSVGLFSEFPIFLFRAEFVLIGARCRIRGLSSSAFRN